MYYYTYKITNLVNNKIYVGIHKTENLETDEYMGSGKILKRAINKHGLSNFKKEIIKFHDSEENMFLHESEIVDQKFVDRKDTYNLKLGGHGGWDYLNNFYWQENSRLEYCFLGGKTHSNKLKSDPEYRKNYCQKMKKVASDRLDRNIIPFKDYRDNNENPFKGKLHSDESKRLISEKMKISSKGEGNSQFGTMWIYSDIEKRSIKINKDSDIPDGWNKGRKIKF